MGHLTVLGRVIAVVLLLVGNALNATAQSYTPPLSNRASMPLSGAWRFLKADSPGSEVPTFDDSSWQSVTVPHTWNALDGQDGPAAGAYYRGVGRYRRHFSVPATYAGRRVFLQFDGANLITDVWVNGLSVGRHEGGYTTFRFDVTAAVNTAAGNDNVITVKVDNSNSLGIAPLSGDFTFFGGIYRDVSLVTTDPLAGEMLDYGSAGVYLTQTNVSQTSATLEIKTLVSNAWTTGKSFGIKTVIVNAAGTIVQTAIARASLAANSGGSFIQNTTIANPHLWDGRTDPYLYSVYVEIHEGDENGPLRDLVPAQPLGLRSFYLDPNQGFFLNGHYLDLHGVNRHQDRLDKGWAISQSDHDQDMRMIEEIGATAVRLAHYPHAQYFYSLADRDGMIVWAEIPFVNGRGGQTFALNARQQLIEMIRQNYNHPAVVFWGIGNEVRQDSQLPDPTSLLIELHALAKQEDPYRLTTLASCCSTEVDPTTVVTDTVGYNTYFGWYYGSYSDFGGWADSTHAGMPGRPVAVSEFGAGASVFLHPENPALNPNIHNEVYQASFHEAHWIAMKTRPFLWGKFVWNMFDFASDARSEGDTFGRNDKGLVTFDRQMRKDAFYWYKANWTTAPMVYVTSRRWTDRTVGTVDVKVYANTDSVELVVNGISLSTKTTVNNPHRLFVWTNVILSVGANTVQAIARTASQTVTDTVTWNVIGDPPLPSPPPTPGGFTAAINFQLASAPPHPGYLVDGGALFGDRGNGLSYGWNQEASARARDRNNLLSPDQRYDTLIHMDAMTWEIAVPNGTYTVRAVVGDPSFPDVKAKLTIEGVLAIDGLNSVSTPWLQGTVTVIVSDGRLTVGNQAGSYNKICFIEIAAIVVPNQPPVVSVTSPVNGATFTSPTALAFIVGASDPDGSVIKVEFFDGTTKLGEDTNGADGWGLAWTNASVGAHTLTARATDNASAATVSSAITITILAPPPSPSLVFMRLDVGSAASFTDSAGNVWSPDQFANAGILSSKPNAVANTVDDDLYRTYRYGNFQYAIPIANGTYDVTLSMMETWWDGSGRRLFSVSAEGSTTLANLDLFAIAGKFTAIERTFSVSVTDGALNLSFTGTIDNATVSAIAIARQP